jgi:ElaB/YqjD/DUF883 family membrane-anchored ribosome-binding protein
VDSKPDLILYDIEQTRNSLTQKIGQLENQVKGTVEDAKNSIEHSFENIKAGVDGSIKKIGRTLNPRLQVEQHPWGMVGASVVAGFFVGNWLVRRPAPPIPTESRSQAASPTILSRVSTRFEDEINLTKSVLFSAVLSSIGREMQKLFPSAAEEIGTIVDKTNTKLKMRSAET